MVCGTRARLVDGALFRAATLRRASADPVERDEPPGAQRPFGLRRLTLVTVLRWANRRRGSAGCWPSGFDTSVRCPSAPQAPPGGSPWR